MHATTGLKGESDWPNVAGLVGSGRRYFVAARLCHFATTTDFPVCGSSAEECEQAWGRSRDRYTVSGQVYPVLSMHGRGPVLTSACTRAQWVGYTPSESARASFDETKEADIFSEGARHESAGSNNPQHRGASEAAGQDIVVRVSHVAKRSSTHADRRRNFALTRPAACRVSLQEPRTRSALIHRALARDCTHDMRGADANVAYADHGGEWCELMAHQERRPLPPPSPSRRWCDDRYCDCCGEQNPRGRLFQCKICKDCESRGHCLGCRLPWRVGVDRRPQPKSLTQAVARARQTICAFSACAKLAVRRNHSWTG
jgi:hypothetical protein